MQIWRYMVMNWKAVRGIRVIFLSPTNNILIIEFIAVR